MSNRLFIFMALYAEAKPLIKRLQLKREDFSHSFDVYADREAGIYLWLTGSGSISAATAVGSCMSYYGADAGDVLMNIGTCAAEGESGEIFLCHRITEQVTGYTFYPDIWYRHDFREAELITVPKVLERGTDFAEDSSKKPEKIVLYDMEAAAIYQAASYYLGPHQMCFLKIVSDAGNGKNVTAEMLSDLIEGNADRILGQIDWMRQSAFMWDLGMAEAVNAKEKAAVNAKEKAVVNVDVEQTLATEAQWQQDCERLCEELHCSQTMRAAVEQCIRYWSLAGVDYKQILGQMREDGLLPCRDKREGKQRFEELRKRLL